MIRVILTDCKWGVDPSLGGAQINIWAEDSDQLFHIPFQDNALPDLIVMLAAQLTEDQKAEVIQQIQEQPPREPDPEGDSGAVQDFFAPESE